MKKALYINMGIIILLIFTFLFSGCELLRELDPEQDEQLTIIVEPGTVILNPGEDMQISVRLVLPSGTIFPTGIGAAFHMNRNNVAEVNGAGSHAVIIAKNPGFVTLTVSHSLAAVDTQVGITVREINPVITGNHSYTAVVGETISLSARLENASQSDNTTLEWFSSNPNILNLTENTGAEINAQALAPGQANVIVSHPNYLTTLTITVSVIAPTAPPPINVPEIRLTTADEDLNQRVAIGDDINLFVRVLNGNGGEEENITWIVSNDRIATIDRSVTTTTGALNRVMVRIRAAGRTTVTASLDGSENSITFTIVVIEPITFNLPRNEMSIQPDHVLTRSFTIAGTDADINNSKWFTSDISVASVQRVGSAVRITAHKEGIATITGRLGSIEREFQVISSYTYIGSLVSGINNVFLREDPDSEAFHDPYASATRTIEIDGTVKVTSFSWSGVRDIGLTRVSTRGRSVTVTCRNDGGLNIANDRSPGTVTVAIVIHHGARGLQEFRKTIDLTCDAF